MIITTNKTICVIDGKENSLVFLFKFIFLEGVSSPLICSMRCIQNNGKIYRIYVMIKTQIIF